MSAVAEVAPPPAVPPAVQLRGIDKRFGAVHANRAVDLTVPKGTIHGIVGENGAGKSTLMSILYGFYQADAGRISIDGAEVQIKGSSDAIAHGVGMVHQHFMLVDTLSALDNVMLGAEPHWQLGKARALVRARLEPLMRSSGLQVQIDKTVAELPVGERQRLEILKTLYRGAHILILDEPTAVLTPAETEVLFETLRGLRAQGTTILLITHKLKEIMSLCDAVTVMRAGAVVLDSAIADTSIDGLAEAMVGRSVHLGRRDGEGTRATGPELLRASGLGWRDALGVARLDDVSITLRAGEIVGIAGVSGNGQSELLDLLSGMHAPQQGTLQVGAERFEPGRWIEPGRARALRIAHVPEDRHARGLVLPFPAWESAVLGYQGGARYSRGGWMKQQAMQDDCAGMMEHYDVRPRNPRLRSSKFSGGNQQKLVLAREALPEPQVLLVGQPTRGVDIGAIEFIHGRLRAMRDAGGAVLLVSSELDEILALSDRVIVMNAGRITGELPIAQCDEATLGRLMGGALH
ncbi:ABC transporter ATP-binding protein [Pseudorhodoferax sp.]|uniref:ABC transporter ATP-binding protein n=1 Tax=Pseudorhodoferax sp. TaxID=1993553 RepID=UPI002DD6908C|nr:ABC transporter ATP-binding protein [Pseudorhodoferax sp.]